MCIQIHYPENKQLHFAFEAQIFYSRALMCSCYPHEPARVRPRLPLKKCGCGVSGYFIISVRLCDKFLTFCPLCKSDKRSTCMNNFSYNRCVAVAYVWATL